ncbi:PREDICTED: uncharacterized protein KIAA1109-like [Priapulus caudatus]|uniref:Uncharacterized protein KIAA1109-like n=1 Tax=Priapulus caudatus TaxID=37621 RepID=A0ABM1EX10_PRICU|nr:PREDICTED: uncharacterized protein KIAA1109-like [Priapulus caudatus]XP_014676732.1 PREDICTED: uncharacterized protein KIAA1109-like [Priapulus caudatus]
MEPQPAGADERRPPRSKAAKDYGHITEMIFALPVMQMHLKSEHLQTESEPNLTLQKPLVECSFVTEFEDHILVAVDAESIFFLHDLVTSYIKEKERDVGGASMRSSQVGGSFDAERRSKISNPTELLKQDWREFVCNTWHLEPTVRIMSWGR